MHSQLAIEIPRSWVQTIPSETGIAPFNFSYFPALLTQCKVLRSMFHLQTLLLRVAALPWQVVFRYHWFVVLKFVYNVRSFVVNFLDAAENTYARRIPHQYRCTHDRRRVNNHKQSQNQESYLRHKSCTDSSPHHHRRVATVRVAPSAVHPFSHVRRQVLFYIRDRTNSFFFQTVAF